MLRRTLKICWLTVAAVIVALAVLLSAARLLLPVMSDYRVQIENLAQRLFVSPVSIGSLDAAWHGLSPVLQLNDVRVQDQRLPGGGVEIEEVRVALDLIDSFVHREWRTAGIKLIGTEFDLHTDLRNPQRPINLQLVLDWLLQQDSISLEKVQLHWTDPGLFEAPLRLSDLSAQLLNQRRHHQLLIESGLPASMGKAIRVAADLHGLGGDVSDWNGTLYIKTDGLQLTALRPMLLDTALVAKGGLDLELWMGVDKAHPEWGNGTLQLNNPSLHNASADAQGVAADRLSGRFHWHKRNNEWRIGVEDFELARNRESVWPKSRVDLEVTTGREMLIQGTATLLVLEELNAVLPLIPWVDDNALAMVDRIQPRGMMRDAHFEFRHQPGDDPRFALRAAVENLSLAANGGLPGASGLSGFVEGNLQAGYLNLDTQKAELVVPHLFPGQALPLSRINGQVRWQRYQQAFRLESEHMQVASGALKIDSRWRMDWAYEQAAPWLDLQLAADELPLTEVQAYLPSGVMSPKAVSWLQDAFRAGTAENIRMLLQGRLDQMPFDHGQGRFEARFDFADVVLDYHPTWGQLDDLNGHAVFSGRSMQLTGTSARLLESRVERVVAEIGDLQLPLLSIDGTIGGTLAGMLEYVNTSPLKTDFGGLVSQIGASGDAQLQLNLSIPLKRGMGRVEVDGDVTLNGNDLQPKQTEIGLENINGVLHFTRESLSVSKARARLMDQPVELNVYRQGKTGASATVVDLQGDLKLVDRLKAGSPSIAPYFEGNSHWQALLEIRNQPEKNTPRMQLKLLSDLRGVKIDLPEPLNKQAVEERRLSIAWVPGKERIYPMQVTYGEMLKASVQLQQGGKGVRRAGVRIGGGGAVLPERDELRIDGDLQVFDLDGWLPVFRAGGNTGRDALRPAVSLTAGLFRFAGFEAANISARSQSSDPWYFLVDGQDADGWVRWVPGGASWESRLLVNMERLKFEKVAKQTDESPAFSATATEIPELDVTVGALDWGGRNLGRVEVVSKRVAAGTSFEKLKLNAPAIAFNGQGVWLEQQRGQISRFNATVNGGSLEQLTDLLGAGRGVHGGELKGDVQLSWPGSPVDLRLATLEGEISLEARDGRLTGVDEGPGKLLSLFSLNSLQRRLNLDFRDVVKEGFSFDKMSGRFVVMDGDAFTNDFTIEGTSVRIDISGRTGLVARDYDQLVTVTPQVTSTLPIAGAIAGGPAVGAAVFLADKLVGDKFNRLTQVQYQVSGGWEDPVYTRIRKERKQTRDNGG